VGIEILKVHKMRSLFFATALCLFFLGSPSAGATEIVIVGDTTLRPVNDIVNYVNDGLPYNVSVYRPQDVRGRLSAVVNGERAKVVVALGSDAIGYALSLPESVPVVYGLVVKPVNTRRRNVSGVYMATPVSEYLSYVNRFFPALKKVGLIYGPGSGDIGGARTSGQLVVHKASNSYEFIKGVSELDRSVDAFLLMPERDLLTSTSVEELFRLSFSGKVPVIGVSEKYVRKGALFALVFNEASMGRQIAEVIKKVLTQGDASGIPPAPPEKYDLYLNLETARKMRIAVPADLLRRASRIFQ
jgi:putative ABC transport system substrate-binding protein